MGKSWIKKRRNDFLFALISFLFLLPKLIPRALGIRLFEVLGKLFFLYPTIEKKTTYKNLSLIYSKTWSEEKIKQTATSVYANFGRNSFDALYLSQCSQKKFNALVSYNDNFNKIMQLHKKGQGAIFVNAHLGCFEMTVQLFARSGMNCLTIGKKLYDDRVDRLVKSMRQRNNITYLYRDGSARDIIRFVKNGGMFGCLLDQDTQVEGVFADFLGTPAFTPSGPIRIAMKYSIPVFVVYSGSQNNHTHYVYISDRIPLEKTNDFTRDLVMNVQKINNLICEGIKRYPEQYAWMHRRWKSRPEDERYKNIPQSKNYS